MKGRISRALHTMFVIVAGMLPVVTSHAEEGMHESSRVMVHSDGWELVGDLVIPESSAPVAAILLLNQAAGDRRVYGPLAAALADHGMASLRLDLRGHGESVNLGKFVPGEQPRSPMIWNAESDVIAAIEYLKDLDVIDASRLAVVGGSYSGEEMAEAGRMSGYAAAYVALSPGSFSEASIRGIDISGAPWLFITSRNERFLQDIRAAVTDESRTVEQIIVPGTGHATNLLREYPDLAETIAVWLENRL